MDKIEEHLFQPLSQGESYDFLALQGNSLVEQAASEVGRTYKNLFSQVLFGDMFRAYKKAVHSAIEAVKHLESAGYKREGINLFLRAEPLDNWAKLAEGLTAGKKASSLRPH